MLTGPQNASGATMFLAIVQGAEHIEMIGQPTGGSAEGPTGGLLFTLTLPHSGIQVNIPVLRSFVAVAEPKPGLGVMPKVIVKPTLADFIAKRDPVLAAALK